MKNKRLGKIVLAAGLAAVLGSGCKNETNRDSDNNQNTLQVTPYGVYAARGDAPTYGSSGNQSYNSLENRNGLVNSQMPGEKPLFVKGNAEKGSEKDQEITIVTQEGYKFLEAAGVSKEKVDKFNKRFYNDPSGIAAMNRVGVTPEEANQFPSLYDASDIRQFHLAGVDKDYAEKMQGKFTSSMIVQFKGLGLDYEEITEFEKAGFRLDQMIDLRRKGDRISAKDAASYGNEIATEDVLQFYKNKDVVSPTEARKIWDLNKLQGVDLRTYEIITLKRQGFTYEEIRAEARKAALEKIVR